MGHKGRKEDRGKEENVTEDLTDGFPPVGMFALS